LLAEPAEDRAAGSPRWNRRRVLVYGDIDLNIIDGSAIWLVSIAEAVSLTDSEVHLLLKTPVKNARLLERLAWLAGIRVHQPAASPASVGEGMTPAEAASRLVEIDRDLHAAVVIARGMQVCAEITKLPSLAHRLWSYVTDLAFPADAMSPHQRRVLHQIVGASRRVFAQTEDARAYLEATIPAAAGKCLVLNPMIPNYLFHDDYRSDATRTEGPLRLVYSGKFAKNWRTLEMCELTTRLAELGIEAELTLIGDKFQEDKDDSTWHLRMQSAVELPSVNWLGGMNRDEALAHVRQAEIGLSWRSSALDDSLEISTKVLEYAAAGVAPLLNRTHAHEELFGSDYPFFLEQDAVAEVARVLRSGRGRLPETRLHTREAVRSYSISESARRLEGYFLRAEGDLSIRIGSGQPMRVLLAGHDFKFAGELVELLESRSDVDLRFDHWRTLHNHDETSSERLNLWADVVMCEWAGPNAVWYAAHRRPGQRLVVRLHRFELEGSWLSSLRFDAVDALVTVSPKLRQDAISRTGWDPDKIMIIPNTVDTLDLNRPKLAEAEYRLGIVGIVPFLKRPDRAVDVLKRLVEVDPRFTLHIRGRLPWEYPYVWNKATEREAYLAFFEEFGHSCLLADHVAFEPFGADMGSWLRKMGFVLSSSTSESFHLAPIEGMASGSIPIVWEREGAHDIFPDRFIVADDDAAVRLILKYVNLPARRAAAAEFAKTHVSRFDVAEVGQQWLRCLFPERAEHLQLELADSVPLVRYPAITRAQ